MMRSGDFWGPPPGAYTLIAVNSGLRVLNDIGTIVILFLMACRYAETEEETIIWWHETGRWINDEMLL